MSQEIGFKALHDIVLIRREEASKTTQSGLILPGTSARKAYYGEVLAVGPGRHSDQTGVFVETTVIPGQRVVFGEQSGTQIELEEFDENDDLIIMRELEVVGILPSSADVIEEL